jgi:hypothetical protein
MVDRLERKLGALASLVVALWMFYWQRRTEEGAFSDPYWC